MDSSQEIPPSGIQLPFVIPFSVAVNPARISGIGKSHPSGATTLAPPPAPSFLHRIEGKDFARAYESRRFTRRPNVRSLVKSDVVSTDRLVRLLRTTPLLDGPVYFYSYFVLILSIIFFPP